MVFTDETTITLGRRQISQPAISQFSTTSANMSTVNGGENYFSILLGSLEIVDAECDSVVVPEIEFPDVALQVSRADVLIDPVDATLQAQRARSENGSRITPPGQPPYSGSPTSS